MKKSPLTRKKPLTRKTPLKRGKAPKRRTPLRSKGGCRFPKRRTKGYGAFVRTFPCVLSSRYECEGSVECDHVVTRGAGGSDVDNAIPQCHKHHMMRHRIGIESFQEKFEVDLLTIAKHLGNVWRKQQKEGK